MTTPAISEETVSKYWEFMNGSDSTLSAQNVFTLLRDAEQYLVMVSQREASGETSQADATKIRVSFRNAAKSLLNRSHGLDPQARQALKDFIFQQPEFLPGEYKFTTDLFSQNVKVWGKAPQPLCAPAQPRILR